ncbi:MAG: Ig-like domain-containing protein [Ethanoligenens sp.]
MKGSDLANRPDVAQIHATGNYANIDASGYSLPVDTSALASGVYTLAVAGIGQDGTVQWATCTFTVAHPQPLTDIDTPAAGATVGGKTIISGWALNTSGINRVDVYAYDSQGIPHSLGSVPSDQLIARGDVQTAFPQYNTLNSGYIVKVDITQLVPGTYTLAVAGIGNDGSVQWNTRPFNAAKLNSLTTIDTPSAGSAVGGSLSVSGWALNNAGIGRVDVYAYDSNGNLHSLGSVSSNQLAARPDVQTAFPQYDTLNSGYALTVNTTQLVPGTYMLAVAGIGKDGTVQWATKTVTVTAPAPLTTIDTPAAGSTVNGTVDVSGWALNASGINRVDIYAYNEDGDPYSLGSVPGSQLTARGDVQNVFPQYNLLNSGYILSVDTDDLMAGNYTLAVAGIGNNGTVQWATKNITVGAPFLLNVDSPSNGDTVSGSFNVKGWTLNHAGIYMVAAYVYNQNGTLLKSGYVTGDQLTARPDVKSIYGKQPYGNLDASGFNFQVDVSTLPAGNYPVGFACIGNDGDIQILLGSINIK